MAAVFADLGWRSVSHGDRPDSCRYYLSYIRVSSQSCGASFLPGVQEDYLKLRSRAGGIRNGWNGAGWSWGVC
ncbi:hypothetical protein AFLA_003960 [Aspergillus flavus NRRL3357]|nr:hypothetical protein AFLA_003960 [Aspergillus flavus NRRL3357]